MNHQSPVTQYVERLLHGAVDAVARAVAKGVESLSSDAQKALLKEAKKAGAIGESAAAWRAKRLGDEDVPEELR